MFWFLLSTIGSLLKYYTHLIIFQRIFARPIIGLNEKEKKDVLLVFVVNFEIPL